VGPYLRGPETPSLHFGATRKMLRFSFGRKVSRFFKRMIFMVFLISAVLKTPPGIIEKD